MRKGALLAPPPGLYEEFAARFPYDETEDQERAIEAVLDDLASGQPMDRLICGDVGFGKTEVALRAAFVVAMAGKQVAILAPTTLLVRQHFQVMRERFAGLPLRIEQVSRFVPAKQVARDQRGPGRGRRRHRGRHARAARRQGRSSGISASSWSTRSSISASRTRRS